MKNTSKENKVNKMLYYEVRLDYLYETAEGGNQWSGPDSVIEHRINKNVYRFINRDNAERHLDGFIKSRPSDENWCEVDCMSPIVKHYRLVVDDAIYAKKEYQAYITELEFDYHFNDGIVRIETEQIKSDNEI